MNRSLMIFASAAALAVTSLAAVTTADARTYARHHSYGAYDRFDGAYGGAYGYDRGYYGSGWSRPNNNVNPDFQLGGDR